jgi:hypothetical protein
MTWKYSVHVRCACKGPDRKLLGQQCPQLCERTACGIAAMARLGLRAVYRPAMVLSS